MRIKHSFYSIDWFPNDEMADRLQVRNLTVGKSAPKSFSPGFLVFYLAKYYFGYEDNYF
jgi:hypothetical protein